MARNPHEATAQAGGKRGYSGGTHGAYGGGDGQHVKTKTTFAPEKKTTTGDGIKTAATIYSAIKHPVISAAKYIGQKIFQPKTEQQKADYYTKKGFDVNNPNEMIGATTRTPIDRSHEGNGMANVTTHTQSLVTAPTADQGPGFGHQWDFRAYPGTPGTTYDPKVYAKHGKMISKYGTGQEVKNFSKGKRFGPPPLKGPDPQGLQTLLENSDYFKKLIG